MVVDGFQKGFPILPKKFSDEVKVIQFSPFSSYLHGVLSLHTGQSDGTE